jgi:hypothetical protein
MRHEHFRRPERVAGLMILLTALSVSVRAQAPANLPAPVQLTNAEERQRMLDLLKVSAIPPGAVSSSPTTYDEAAANPYPDLPDPLRFKSGERVASAGAWRSRRAEILDDFEREVYGRRPPHVPAVKWEIASTTNATEGDVAVTTKQLLGRVDNASYPLVAVNIRANITTPAKANGRVPVILQLGFVRPTEPSAAMPVNPCAPPGGASRGAAGRGGPPRGGRGGGPTGPTWQEQVLARGWGYAVLDTYSVQADCGAGLTSGIIGLVNKGQPRKADDWGALSAWAWGASRLLDYMETDKTIDTRRVGLQGHSRWGKAALVALAFDERFAIAYVSSSGHGGAKLHRRKYGETIENVANTYYHWMAGNYLKYAGRWNALPVDSHELIALCAPRPVFISAGNGPGPLNPDGTVPINDAWIDPKGSFLAAVGAGPVYKLLGAKDLGTAEFPPLDTAVIDGDLGFHQHTGGHTAGPTWPTFLTFAERYFARRP